VRNKNKKINRYSETKTRKLIAIAGYFGET